MRFSKELNRFVSVKVVRRNIASHTGPMMRWRSGARKRPATDAQQILARNPKTVKEIRRNNEIMKWQSQSQRGGDDYFDGGGRGKKKPEVSRRAVGGTADDIAKDLFDSESDNDLSMHSARTPIASYLGATTPSTVGVASTTSGPAVSQGLVDQYVVRKMKEMRKLRGGKKGGGGKRSLECREVQQHRPRPSQPGSRQATERESDKLVRPISKYLQHDDPDAEEDDSDEEAEEYFSDDDMSSAINPPSGIQELKRKRVPPAKFDL